MKGVSAAHVDTNVHKAPSISFPFLQWGEASVGWSVWSKDNSKQDTGGRVCSLIDWQLRQQSQAGRDDFKRQRGVRGLPQKESGSRDLRLGCGPKFQQPVLVPPKWFSAKSGLGATEEPSIVSACHLACLWLVTFSTIPTAKSQRVKSKSVHPLKSNNNNNKTWDVSAHEGCGNSMWLYNQSWRLRWGWKAGQPISGWAAICWQWNGMIWRSKAAAKGAGWAGYSLRIGTCDLSASAKADLALPGLPLASGPRAGGLPGLHSCFFLLYIPMGRLAR